jgi:hypothetical protein
MANVSTVTAVWSGFSGGPGYSRLNFLEISDATTANAAGAAVRAFFDALKIYWLSTWTVSVQTVVQTKDLATGDLVNEVTMSTAPTGVVGTLAPSTVYAGGSGFVVDWVTGQFWSGRKVRGRTFIVPAVGVYSNDGTISTAVQNTATAAGNALVADATTNLCVWAKKFNDEDPPQQTSGAAFTVTGTTVPDRAAQLRTRRS